MVVERYPLANNAVFAECSAAFVSKIGTIVVMSACPKAPESWGSTTDPWPVNDIILVSRFVRVNRALGMLPCPDIRQKRRFRLCELEGRKVLGNLRWLD